MEVFSFILLLFLGCSTVHSQDCELLPELPNYYSTHMQVNLVNILRDRDDPEVRGKTVSVFEAVEEQKKARFEYALEQSIDGHDPFIYGETVIWNPELNGVKSFISRGFIGVPPIVQACQTDKLDKDSILGNVFGLTGEQFPSVTSLLHFGPTDGYVCGPQVLLKDIPCNTYSAVFTNEDLEQHINITYYWSDKSQWTSSAGTGLSVPVLATLEGIMKVHPDDDMPKEVEVTVDFISFFEAKPNPAMFLPTPDMWCDGRTQNEQLPQIPDHFSFDSELIYHYDIESDEKPPINVAAKRSEWYDFKMQTSRTDYKPFDVSNPDNPFAGTKGYVSEIKDFVAGIKYVKWLKYGNCSVQKLNQDETGDVTVNPDGTVHMTTAFDFWHLDYKYAVNGLFSERGIDSEVYVNNHAVTRKVGKKEQLNWTTVLYLSAGDFAIEGDTNLQRNVPIKMESYDSAFYNDMHKRILYNIVGFKSSEPDFNLFDITPCFQDQKIAHRVVRLGWNEDLVVTDDLKTFRDNVRSSVTNAAQVTPLRVQNIEVTITQDEAAMYVVFTMVDFPFNSTDGYPADSSISLTQALQNLQDKISTGTFKVTVKSTDGSYGASYADSGYFENVDRSSSPAPSKYKYTSGDMALLAFGMIAMGFLFSGVLYYFVLRPRVRSQLPTVRGFDNPLHGSANLAATT